MKDIDDKLRKWPRHLKSIINVRLMPFFVILSKNLSKNTITIIGIIFAGFVGYHIHHLQTYKSIEVTFFKEVKGELYSSYDNGKYLVCGGVNGRNFFFKRKDVMKSYKFEDISEFNGKIYLISDVQETEKNVGFIAAEITNTGYQPVEESDFSENLKFIFPVSTTILAVFLNPILGENTKEINTDYVFPYKPYILGEDELGGEGIRQKDNEIVLSPVLLQPNDRLRLLFVIKNFPTNNQKYLVQGRIKGVKKINISVSGRETSLKFSERF